MIARNKMARLEGLTPGPTLIDRAYAAILDAIREGRLQPGERLNQDELAARLAISRQPVGQALTILKSQGFVRDNGRRGLLVAGLEPAFVRSIYQLREGLDPLAARLAAERCVPVEASEGKKLIAEGRRAERAQDRAALVEAETRFFQWIYRVAGNPILASTMELYWNHLRRAMLHGPAARMPAWDEHEQLMLAISAQDAAKAEALALAHVERAAPV